MLTVNENIMISVREISETLGWPYTTVSSIIVRQSPKDKYKKVIECEQKLKDAKIQLKQKFQNK